MKKLLIIFSILIFNICSAQTFYAVKVYIANPYVERVGVVKSQMYNMDYVRSHYASCVFSIEDNYINALFDSLQSFSMTRVAHDSIDLLIHSYWGGDMNMNFEPCIVIDFIFGNRYSTNKYNTNSDIWTFSMNKQGFICRTFHTSGNKLCYPNQKCVDFLKRQFPGMFFLLQ